MEQREGEADQAHSTGSLMKVKGGRTNTVFFPSGFLPVGLILYVRAEKGVFTDILIHLCVFFCLYRTPEAPPRRNQSSDLR